MKSPFKYLATAPPGTRSYSLEAWVYRHSRRYRNWFHDWATERMKR